MRRYQLCKRCVMDTSVSDIAFDAEGNCNYCTAAIHRLAREQFIGPDDAPRLEALIAGVRRAGARRWYDCIIGVSGGTDSSYLAYIARRKYNLRPLAVHFDNGWNSELAVENIERLVKGLELDLYTHVVQWHEFRDLQLSFLRASVANAEIPTDHGITALLYRVAASHGVRYILHGGNVSTESIMPDVWMESALDLRFLRGVHERHGTERLTTFPTLGYSRLAYYTYGCGIRFVGLLNYEQYNRREATATLEAELGLRAYGAKHFESIFTRWFQGDFLPRKFGIDKRRAHYASLIASGQMTRDQALACLRNPPYPEGSAREDRAYVQRKLGLTAAEMEAIVQEAPRALGDYPNSAAVLRTLRPLVRVSKAIASARRVGPAVRPPLLARAGGGA